MGPITIALIGVAIVVARVGVVAGKGCGERIREEFGVKWSAFAMFVLIVANSTVTIAEFAGIAAAGDLFDIPRLVSVPLMAVVVWLIVVRASYTVAEKIFILLSTALLTYVGAAFLAQPNWGEVAQALVTPSFIPETGYLTTLAAPVGTTITPSMLAASVLPLSPAYGVCGAFGWERGVSRSWSEAPIFNSLYTALIAIAAAFVLIPGLPLIQVIVATQFLNGLLLPIVLIFVLRLVNDRDVMGRHTNNRAFNVISYGTTGILILLTIALLVSSVLGLG